MREKGKQEWSSEEGQQSPEEASPTKSIKDPAPIDEDGFARKAGEIIARAASHASDAVLHRSKRNSGVRTFAVQDQFKRTVVAVATSREGHRKRGTRR
jgi:hypothetical protein